MNPCAFSKTVHTSRNMSCMTPELTSIFLPCTRTSSYPSARPTSTSPTFHSSDINPCHDPQQASIGYMAGVRTFTGYEPKDLAEKDDLCVKPMFFHRPIITSTYDSAERIATPPPESDLDNEQIRALLASPLYLQEREREASADRSQVYHSVREKLGVKFRRKPVALFSSQRKSSSEIFSDREDSSLEHQQVQGNNEPLFRFSDPKEARRSFLGECKDYICLQQIFSTVLFVIFRNNLIPIPWKSIVHIKAMKNLEKSKPNFLKN